MSRRVVIGILIFLILGVLGGTVALIIARFRTTGTEVSQNPQTSTLPGAKVQDRVKHLSFRPPSLPVRQAGRNPLDFFSYMPILEV